MTRTTGAIWLRLESFDHFDLQFLLCTAQVCSMFLPGASLPGVIALDSRSTMTIY
jgi:hypothetical protein